MCLNTITKRYDTPDPKVRTAWKYVKLSKSGRMLSIFQNTTYSTEWQKAEKSYKIKSNYRDVAYDEQEEYTAGFHVFPTREDARIAARILRDNTYGTFANSQNVHLAKVEVRGVFVEGTDGTTTEKLFLDQRIKNWVAQEMRIVEVL